MSECADGMTATPMTARTTAEIAANTAESWRRARRRRGVRGVIAKLLERDSDQ
jgi:hypothetical protein